MLTPAELVWLLPRSQRAIRRLSSASMRPRARNSTASYLRILRRQDLAEEVIQETYVRIWNNAGQFNPGLSSPITWMASIARNRAIDVVRKRSEFSIEEEPAAMEVAADSPDPLARREMTEELKRCWNASAGSSRTVRNSCAWLLQRLEQGAAGGEIRAPVDTVKTWLRRSMMDIRECLGLMRV